MSNETTTTTHRDTLNPGPFETEAEVRDTSDMPWIPREPAGFSVYEWEGKWRRGFWSTTTLPPIETRSESVSPGPYDTKEEAQAAADSTTAFNVVYLCKRIGRKDTWWLTCATTTTTTTLPPLEGK